MIVITFVGEFFQSFKISDKLFFFAWKSNEMSKPNEKNSNFSKKKKRMKQMLQKYANEKQIRYDL